LTHAGLFVKEMELSFYVLNAFRSWQFAIFRIYGKFKIIFRIINKFDKTEF